MAFQTFTKDPDAVLDYLFDYAAYLQTGETISVSVGDVVIISSVPAELVIDSFTIDAGNTAVRVWVSGGTLGAKYDLTCRIKTTDNRTDDKSISLKIKDK